MRQREANSILKGDWEGHVPPGWFVMRSADFLIGPVRFWEQEARKSQTDRNQGFICGLLSIQETSPSEYDLGQNPKFYLV